MQAATKAGSKQYAETMILLQLIIWVIAGRQAFLCECCLKEKTKEEKTYFPHTKSARLPLGR